MDTTVTEPKKRFYIVTTDILQGFSIFFMVIGHTCLWWDGTLDEQWPNLPFAAWLLLVVAFLVPPGFIFWYTFNTVNSLLRRKNTSERLISRERLLKRTIIFFIIAEFAEVMAALVSGNQIINYLLTWELFHMFALSTIFILVVIELAWYLEKKDIKNYNDIAIIEFLIALFIILLLYIIFHDYSPTRLIPHSVELNLDSIFQRIIIDYGQSPIIPYLGFSAAGGFLATYLNLPNDTIENIKRKSVIPIIFGALSFILGVLLLGIEEYTSPPVKDPISSNLVFIALGFHLMSVTGGILILDLKTLYGVPKFNKLFLPIVMVSQITLSVYLLHNIAFAIPPALVSDFVTTVEVAMLIGLLYTVFWIIIAFIWQRFRFKLSVEWIVVSAQRAKWKWWR
ncbi:MAG: hypothetical protein ACW97P_04055 [Candidatus Hodarchaeales archaeon]|jgi:hypothetical protein